MEPYELTDKQRGAIERLQAKMSPDETPESRREFMRKIVNVRPEELADAPEPPKQKRGRKPK